MAQPTLETVATQVGSGGPDFLAETVGSDLVPVDLISFSTGDGTINVVTAAEPLPTEAKAVAAGGASWFKSIDLDESEEEVKGSAGQLYGGVVTNLSSLPLFFKIYNDTAANVVVGTTVPDLTIPIPTPGNANVGGFLLPFPAQGLYFDTAITVAATTGIADNDAGAPGANACAVALFYK